MRGHFDIALLGREDRSDIGIANQRGSDLLVGGVLALFGWAFTTLFTYLVGAYLLRAPSTSGSFDQVLRALGLAYAPSALIVLGLVRDFRNPILLIAYIWCIVASIVATRQALNVGTGSAVAISIVSGLAELFILVLIVMRLGIDVSDFRGLLIRPAGS